MTDIRITVNDQICTAQLADNPTAHGLIDQLPLTLRFRDFNHVEKIANRPGLQPAGFRLRRPRDQRHRLLRPRAIWFSITAMSVTGTGSYGSVDSTPRT